MKPDLNASAQSPDPPSQRDAVDYSRWFSELPRAAGEPVHSALLRRSAEDFRVVEVPGFELSGQGDHLCLWIEKKQLTTHQVVDRLRAVLGVRMVDIGYFGLKDKQAVTRQWFSVHLPGRQLPATDPALGDGISVLRQVRHQRKFRRGSHQGNHFRIVLRELDGDIDRFGQRVENVYQQGFPNYFAEQRFGYKASNINRALSGFSARNAGRRQRALHLSAARSFLFNINLAQRVREGNWLQPFDDEVLQLSGTQSIFHYDAQAPGAAQLQQRLERQDIHTTGVLWGRGAGIAERERASASAYPVLTRGLEEAGLKVAHRALRASVSNASIHWLNGRDVLLEFELPAGCYATALLRELCRPRS